jgi:HK97 family phage major capsid protein
MTVLELQTQRKRAFDAADKTLAAAESQNRPMTANETQIVDTRMREVKDLDKQIAAAQPRSTAEIRKTINSMPRHTIVASMSATAPSENYGKTPLMSERFSREYGDAFNSFLTGAGPITGSLQEGVSNSGGYAIPITVDRQVVPLAPQDSAVRRLATVVETTSDVKVASITARGTPALRTETSVFATAQPMFGGFELSAFPVGIQTPVSIELLQDVAAH